jgi:hypothetical protein
MHRMMALVPLASFIGPGVCLAQDVARMDQIVQS